MVLTTCMRDECNTEITPEHVIRELRIGGAPMHVALIYRCPVCKVKSRVVSETATWEASKDEFLSRVKIETRRDNIAVAVELSGIETADDLVALWKSLREPPLIEELIGKCGCPSCLRKIYRDS